MGAAARRVFEQRIKVVDDAAIDLQQPGFELSPPERQAPDELFALFLRNQWQVEYRADDSPSPSR